MKATRRFLKNSGDILLRTQKNNHIEILRQKSIVPVIASRIMGSFKKQPEPEAAAGVTFKEPCLIQIWIHLLKVRQVLTAEFPMIRLTLANHAFHDKVFPQ